MHMVVVLHAATPSLAVACEAAGRHTAMHACHTTACPPGSLSAAIVRADERAGAGCDAGAGGWVGGGGGHPPSPSPPSSRLQRSVRSTAQQHRKSRGASWRLHAAPAGLDGRPQPSHHAAALRCKALRCEASCRCRRRCCCACCACYACRYSCGCLCSCCCHPEHHMWCHCFCLCCCCCRRSCWSCTHRCHACCV